MKRLLLMLCVLPATHAVLAQVPSRTASAKPGGGGTNAVMATTNASSPWIELRDIQIKLYPVEESLAQTDPDIKALLQQRKELQQNLEQLDKKRRELINSKLLANPATAALVKRRTELQSKMLAPSHQRGTGEMAAPGGRTAGQPEQPGVAPGRTPARNP